MIIKSIRYNCRWRIFLNKKKLKKNIGISITESLTTKGMEILNQVMESFSFRNVWALDERICYLAEGSKKSQILRN